jgi:pimeloyl-ACP methyl ester carboxylesterase
MSARLVSMLERGARFLLNRRGFASRTIGTSAGPVHVYDARGRGALPPTVVLHGLGSAASAFGPVLDRLLPEASRVVAPDLPGHGFSVCRTSPLTARALVGAVDQTLDEIGRLVGRPMVLVGSSLGGALALRYATRRPDRVAALALVSPAGARLAEHEWDELLGAFRIESAAEARRLVARLYHRTPWYLPALAPGVRVVMNRRAVCDLLATASPADLPEPGALRALVMPVLLLWGESERLLPPSALEYFRRHLPAHALIERPVGFGHCPHLDDPPRLAARLIEFARRGTAAS